MPRAARNNGAKTTKDTRFKPGNPGRPAGARHKTTVLAEKLMADDAEGIVHAVITAAKGGDMQAARIVMERMVPVRRGRPAPFKMPKAEGAAGISEAFRAVIGAMATGELTPDEASSVATVLEANRKALETAAFEERLQALEEAIAK